MRASPETRTAAFYFVMFLSGGIANTYLGIWLHDRGLSEQDIGIVNAVPVLVMVVLNIAVGRIADRAPDWRGAIVIGALLSGLFPFGLIWATSFWPILLFWTLHMVAHMAVVTVTDAAALRMASRSARDFGFLRAWGTAGYLITLVLMGYAAIGWGPAAFLPLFLAAGVIRAAVALTLPRFRAPDGVAPSGGARHLRAVLRPWFLLPLVGFACINATHWLQNAFQALIWQGQGIGTDMIGILIAVGALSETILFFVFARAAGRYRARTLLLISALLSVVRWAAMAFAPSLPWLFLLQSMHGLTYALGFMAGVRFIANWTSEDIAAEAQGLFTTLNQIMAVIALLAFGWLLEHFADRAFLGAAALALVGAGLIALSRRVQGPA